MIELVIEQRRRDLGGGMEVGRILPFHKRRMVGPFIFFDHMGPLDLEAGKARAFDILPHPHIGLSTVTYLYDGEIMHRDSVGSELPIRPGEVNWMTAGRGITHSERFDRAQAVGDHLHGIQAWVALPAADEECDPAFSHHEGAELPQWDENGVSGRLIAGSAFGLTAAAQTHSPLFCLHLEMTAGSRAEVPSGYHERAIHVATGRIEIAGQYLDAGQMAVLRTGPVSFSAPVPATVMLLGGAPLGKRHIYWNFVSSSSDRIEQAKADWQAGRMKLPDLDNQEYIPLPARSG